MPEPPNKEMPKTALELKVGEALRKATSAGTVDVAASPEDLVSVGSGHLNIIITYVFNERHYVKSFEKQIVLKYACLSHWWYFSSRNHPHFLFY